MIVVYGTRLYGRIHTVPGLFYLATNFFHLFWVPVLPLGTHIVVEEAKDGWRGVPFGLKGKSVLAGYLRGPLIIGGLISLLVHITMCFSTARPPAGELALRIVFLGIAPLLIGLATFVLWQRPSEAEFLEICAKLGIDPDAPLSAEAEQADGTQTAIPQPPQASPFEEMPSVNIDSSEQVPTPYAQQSSS